MPKETIFIGYSTIIYLAQIYLKIIFMYVFPRPNKTKYYRSFESHCVAHK